ncbi:MAG: cation-transporting P-type ATPase [Chloroflexi bacterium]|nr:cation-transporting P-type ATPase [Chloroflexota bacterium]
MSVGLELRTERALEQLRRLSAPTARVRRDGRWTEVPAEEIVPGDVVEIREGDVVPADARVFSGTRVLSGRAEAIVEATGMATRYGVVAALLATARRPRIALAVAGLAVIGPEVLKLARWTRPART